MCPRQFPASEENALFSTTYVSSRWRDPVATCGALWNPEALASYNFIYSRFPPTARSGPSSPRHARLSSSSGGWFSWSQGESRQVQGGAISQKAVSGPRGRLLVPWAVLARNQALSDSSALSPSGASLARSPQSARKTLVNAGRLGRSYRRIYLFIGPVWQSADYTGVQPKNGVLSTLALYRVMVLLKKTVCDHPG